jgi:quinol monooxygenase YgiN
MIKVIMGFNVKLDADIQPALLDLQAYALQSPGFLSAENLAASRDSALIIYVTSWQNLANWDFYEKSMITQKLIQRIRDVSLEEPKVTVYRPLATPSWR